jgi:16S rRNA (cytosine1402-N4)-methyltransferase
MHEPVMVEEVMNLMAIRTGGTYVDGTVGDGGHAEAILNHAGAGSRLLGLDRDDDAVSRARQRLASRSSQVSILHGNFSDLADLAAAAGFEAVDAVLLDLGVSSGQLNEAARGFSFQQDGPLDMRMDRSRGPTAADLVNTLDAKMLADVLWRLGEERASRRIAAAVVEARREGEIRTTGRLADLVARAKGGRRGRIHPATQTFQALRMEVNRELEHIERGIEAALKLVRVGGRVAVITFHSIEDRLVKQTFVRHVGRWESLDAGGRRWVGMEPRCQWIDRKPLTPSSEEVRRNPRARSAKLRVVERTN